MLPLHQRDPKASDAHQAHQMKVARDRLDKVSDKKRAVKAAKKEPK